jgi:uncharacterized coiled-coil protein SlyX
MTEEEQRLIQLETQLAFRLLQQQLQLLSQRFRELQRNNEVTGQQPGLADERPPHY